MAGQQPNIGSIAQPRPEAFIPRKLRELQRQMDADRTARTGNAMTVDGAPGISVNNGGNVRINDGGALYMATPDNRIVFAAARENIPDGSGRTQQTVRINRDDGSTAWYVGDYGTTAGHTHYQNWALVDRAGNGVVAEDTVSGVGLSSPAMILCSWVNIVAPTVAPVPTTNGTAWTAVQWGDAVQTMPRASLAALVYRDGTAVGQARITSGGVQMGSPIAITGFTNGLFPAAVWPGTYSFEQRVLLQLEVRITSGTGNVGAAGMGLVGSGS